ncbi:uncharacterized protein PG986_004450 [Apiospora aurea]|uniref:Knr4/Smi1-like domain-containing protein n=1 Tax=Apiospora aurea TaxID=335848 RepID=A0ABR1QMM0_9PEZI
MIENTVTNRAEILEGLANYRKHVAARNRYALEQYVRLAETAEPNDLVADLDEAAIAEERMRFLEYFVGQGFDRLAGGRELKRPADLLAHYDEVAPQLGLDGTCRPCSLSEADRRLNREAYVAAIEAYLRAHCRASVRDGIAFPAELLVVAEQVDCLHGPGLEPEREQQGIPFWTMLDLQKTPQLVVEPDELAGASSLVEVSDLEVAAGWNCGHGYPGDAYVLLCREPPAEADDKDNDDARPWSWKYTVDIDFAARLFHSIPEFLEAYKDICAVDTAVYPEYGVEDVFGGVP